MFAKGRWSNIPRWFRTIAKVAAGVAGLLAAVTLFMQNATELETRLSAMFGLNKQNLRAYFDFENWISWNKKDETPNFDLGTKFQMTIFNKGTEVASINEISLWIGLLSLSKPMACEVNLDAVDYETNAVVIEPGKTKVIKAPSIKADNYDDYDLHEELNKKYASVPFSLSACVMISIATPRKNYLKEIKISRRDYAHGFSGGITESHVLFPASEELISLQDE